MLTRILVITLNLLMLETFRIAANITWLTRAKIRHHRMQLIPLSQIIQTYYLQTRLKRASINRRLIHPSTAIGSKYHHPLIKIICSLKNLHLHITDHPFKLISCLHLGTQLLQTNKNNITRLVQWDSQIKRTILITSKKKSFLTCKP